MILSYPKLDCARRFRPTGPGRYILIDADGLPGSVEMYGTRWVVEEAARRTGYGVYDWLLDVVIVEADPEARLRALRENIIQLRSRLSAVQERLANVEAAVEQDRI